MRRAAIEHGAEYSLLMFSSVFCLLSAVRQTTARALLYGALGTAALAACDSGPDAAQVGTRPWGAFDVAVEVRPAPPRPGHNEVVVIITGERHRPVYDALVAVRADPAREWVQAMEDGHVGVYRRAVYFAPGATATLQLRLQRAGTESLLEFPVTLAR